LFLLTVPFGTKRIDELERTYDREALHALLEGWEVDDVTVIRRRDRLTWVATADDDGSGPSEGVALVTAHRG
jgi:hypothetical protein